MFKTSPKNVWSTPKYTRTPFFVGLEVWNVIISHYTNVIILMFILKFNCAMFLKSLTCKILWEPYSTSHRVIKISTPDTIQSQKSEKCNSYSKSPETLLLKASDVRKAKGGWGVGRWGGGGGGRLLTYLHTHIHTHTHTVIKTEFSRR